MTIDFSDLDYLPRTDRSETEDTRKKFPCMKCSGTGVYTFGYINPRSGKCHACNGRGHFLTDPRTRQKAKVARHAAARRKSDAAAAAAVKFIESTLGKDVYLWLVDARSWNDFAGSLVEQLNKKGELSDNQVAAAIKMKAKSEATLAAKEAKRNDAAPVIELTKLHELFGKATESGLKKPALTIDDVRISKAPDTGVNAGSLYVKKQGQYQGKLTAEGKFFAVRSADESIAGLLNDIAADPEGKLKELGRVTGTCCACGRELTDKESIRKGIGPICEQRWF